jgi:hypothetical protein
VPGRRNPILGNAEILVEPIPRSGGSGGKTDVYSMAEAVRHLAPHARATAVAIAALPELACPDDHAVALAALHPTYLAKSHFPDRLLRDFGLKLVGSRQRHLVPRKVTRGTPGEPQLAAELYLAGRRDRFQEFAGALEGWRAGARLSGQIIRIEEVRPPSAARRSESVPADDRETVLQVTLHVPADQRSGFILDGFEAYARSLRVTPIKGTYTRAGGLCFVAVRASQTLAERLAQFSYVRQVRQMPALALRRTATPPAELAEPGRVANASSVILPHADAADPTLRVAIFDAGLPEGGALDRWVTSYVLETLDEPLEECLEHGLAVTSALLFGPLQPGEEAPTPLCRVDHYRIADRTLLEDDTAKLLPLLERIRQVLVQQRYDFVNLSMGPEVCVEDNDVHPWTSVLDPLFAANATFVTVAAGNHGNEESNRISPPADCVNALAIGAVDAQHFWARRASYSAIGPGRSPGVIKPDALHFGGSDCIPADEFFVVAGPEDVDGKTPIRGTWGTSLAAPATLRTAIGLRAAYGPSLSPVALKALLLHTCEEGFDERVECGWGRIATDLDEVMLTRDDEVRVLFRGTFEPGQRVRMPIPFPAAGVPGEITLRSTFCFLSRTDPEHPLSYTRSGLEITFRPDASSRRDAAQQNPDSFPLFRAKDYRTEAQLRNDAHKWETTLQVVETFPGDRMMDPVFDVFYNARVGGRRAGERAESIPYALVVTLRAPSVPDLYNRVFQRYRTQLSPLNPVLRLPLRS